MEVRRKYALALLILYLLRFSLTKICLFCHVCSSFPCMSRPRRNFCILFCVPVVYFIFLFLRNQISENASIFEISHKKSTILRFVRKYFSP